MSATTEVVAPKKPGKPATAVSNLTLGSADDALTLAKELQKFVQKNSLTSSIQGKQFPNVEAWQFAGSLLGLSPMLESIEDKSTANEIKWQATVIIQNLHTGAIVGRGFATCSNKEHTKKSFADYAICSMAQTRAVGKAYRLSLGWLMKAAGYEATPLEEMEAVQAQAEPETSATVVNETAPDYTAEIAAARQQIEASTSSIELRKLYDELPKPVAVAVKQDAVRVGERIKTQVAADAAGMSVEQYLAQPDPY